MHAKICTAHGLSPGDTVPYWNTPEVWEKAGSMSTNCFYSVRKTGDIEYITGKDGKVENAYTYDAFGNITNSQELIKNRYTYNGEQYDQVTQQYYLRARCYNPLVGRFTQEDVYRGDGLNLYAYCGNNPVMYVDPSGYAKKCGTGSESGTDTTRVRHYTNSKGLKGIEESGIIYAQDNNRVYMEYAKKKPLSSIEAEDFYQLKKGKGRNYVEFDVDTNSLEEIENPRYHRMELTVKGDGTIKNAKYYKRKK